MRARLQARRVAAEQDGFTLVEMLVVLAIVGVILAGITQLLMSAMKSQSDQTNRTQAQTDARLGLDKLRREIRCGNSLTTPSGYPASSITITLGSYCSTAGGAPATVTWCTKGGAQPYTLWRYTGGANCSSPGGTKWVSNLVDNTSPSVAAGKIFKAGLVPDALLTPTTATGGTLQLGTYWYEVTAIVGGGEVPGVAASVSVASPNNAVTVSWPAYPSATSYNVYGRASNGVALLKNVTGTSYLDPGPTSLNPASPATSVTLPNSTIPVVSTSNFNSGTNTIAFGPSGAVTCTGTTSTSFTGCSGGQPGQYPKGMPVDSASSSRPPPATLSVTLPVDVTPADAKQRFVLTDNIVLRNSRP